MAFSNDRIYPDPWADLESRSLLLCGSAFAVGVPLFEGWPSKLNLHKHAREGACRLLTRKKENHNFKLHCFAYHALYPVQFLCRQGWPCMFSVQYALSCQYNMYAPCSEFHSLLVIGFPLDIVVRGWGMLTYCLVKSDNAEVVLFVVRINIYINI